MTFDSMIGAGEAAERLGVSRPTLTRWVQRGKLEPLHKTPGIRGAYVFSERDVERIKKQRQR